MYSERAYINKLNYWLDETDYQINEKHCEQAKNIVSNDKVDKLLNLCIKQQQEIEELKAQLKSQNQKPCKTGLSETYSPRSINVRI